MRILSQDGKIDVPYEQCGFIMFFDELFSGNWVINANITGNEAYKMAEYSTEIKAREAMGMLHEEWIGFGESGLFQFPQESEGEAKGM